MRDPYEEEIGTTRQFMTGLMYATMISIPVWTLIIWFAVLIAPYFIG